MSRFSLIHLSDPHFGSVSCSFAEWCSKAALGQFNWILSRQYLYPLKVKESLKKHLNEGEPCDLLLITGDCTTTAQTKEFESAHDWLDSMQSICKQCLILPGNHDLYTTASAREERFGHYFDSYIQKMDLSLSRKIFHAALNDQWYWIGLDQCLPTPWWSSQGKFSPECLIELEALLKKITHPFILVSGHYPLETSPKNKCTQKRRSLEGARPLLTLLEKESRIKAYLCGHTHAYQITTTASGLIMLNSGSCGKVSAANYSRITLDEGMLIQQISFSNGNWSLKEEIRLTLR